MNDTTQNGHKGNGPPRASLGMAVSEVDVWFVREVLPLESMLMQFLHRNCRSKAEVSDLCQEVYMRVYEAARKELPERAKPFVFTTARNLLINRVRHEQIVSIEAVADLDTLNIAMDEPGPDRIVMARDMLRRLQSALDRLPQRCREAVVLRKVDGLSRAEIATRMGIAENTVNRHLTDGMCLLADMLYGEGNDGGAKQ
jgi:RNA polymerase sigma-70 factor (ECF subfamily)